jgi:hypothetical protein
MMAENGQSSKREVVLGLLAGHSLLVLKLAVNA